MAVRLVQDALESELSNDQLACLLTALGTDTFEVVDGQGKNDPQWRTKKIT